MGPQGSVICTMLYIVIDSVITTLLYIKGTKLSFFTRDILDFNILSSALDLWGIVLIRVALLLGACIGVSWNKEEGPPRVNQVTNIILLFCMIFITYALAKLLMMTEVETLSQQPWFLSLIGWTCASTLAVMLLWRQLGSVSSSVNGLPIRDSISGGGRVSEETENLVDTAGEEDEEVGGRREKEKVSSSATLGRLLGYCRKDAGLLSFAVLFLFISALCEYHSNNVVIVFNVTKDQIINFSNCIINNFSL